MTHLHISRIIILQDTVRVYLRDAANRFTAVPTVSRMCVSIRYIHVLYLHTYIVIYDLHVHYNFIVLGSDELTITYCLQFFQVR